MATAENDSCQRAILASAEVVAEECGGENMKIKNINGNALALVPEDAAEELGLADPDADREEAVESCMNSEWARDWAESVLGPDADDEMMERTKRNVCEGLVE